MTMIGCESIPVGIGRVAEVPQLTCLEPTNTRNKQWLVKRIAWKMQANKKHAAVQSGKFTWQDETEANGSDSPFSSVVTVSFSPRRQEYNRERILTEAC
jgi:hypothetical protein